MNTQQSNVDDVRNGITSYAEMMSLIAAGHPQTDAVLVASAHWAAVLLHRIVAWGVLTEEEGKRLADSLASDDLLGELGI